ncbi:hypothetical protein J0B03_01805 [Alkalibacter rhizosphaerae]|uniref:Uncharacterized protein n=1 Tax=Alkalibacter rhizosphaerae TaxID=2815577 RepID=A0A975AIS8_9FIRM|nr:hypothetical protein [Alkalibacter rhizosphaerae]QSX08845.1 hypothetical protein J0B03_01805 [Alkalibacter rhizosphaerae]
MKGWALLGLILIVYGIAVIGITVKKPKSIWDMAKIRMFRKVLGEQGTVVFFYIFAAVAIGVGAWLMISQ